MPMANNPNSDGLECVLCGALFTTKPDLQEHFRSHGSKNDSQMKDQRVSENIANFNPPSTCELCGFSCANIRSYWQHYRKFHPDWRGIDCAHCGKHFLQKSDYDRHVETHKNDTEENIFICVHCNNKFFSEEALRFHAQGHEQVHQLEAIVQEERNKTKRPKIQPPTFRLKASYCKLCRCQFGTSTALAQHLVTHGIFLCLTCGKEFTNDETFRDHQKVHLPSSALIPSVSRKNSVKTCKRNKKK